MSIPNPRIPDLCSVNAACVCQYTKTTDGTLQNANITMTGWTGLQCQTPPAVEDYSCKNQKCRATFGKKAEEQGGNLTLTAVRAKGLINTDFLPGTGERDPYVVAIVMGYCVVPTSATDGVGTCYRPAKPGVTFCDNDNIGSDCRRTVPERTCTLRPLPNGINPYAPRPHADCEVRRSTQAVRSTLSPVSCTRSFC